MIIRKDVEQISAELQDLYRELAEKSQTESGELQELSANEARFAVSQWAIMSRRFRRNKAAMFGGVIVLFFYLITLAAPFVAPYGLTTRFVQQVYLPPQQIHLIDEGQFRPFVYEVITEFDSNLRRVYRQTENKLYLTFFARGEAYKLFGLIETDIHLFLNEQGGLISLLGTDRQGRDMFSRIIYGSQISLTIGLVGVVLSLILGTVFGIASGYFGGWVDDIIQRLIEIVRAFPTIPLWMALSAAIPAGWSQQETYFAITVILSLIGWTWLARQLRGMVLSLRESDYVMAARLAGASHARIIFKHLIPATFGQIIVVATLALPAMIIAETALSFLGLGLRPPITSWGVLLQEAQNFESLALYPWVLSPAIVIVIAILAFSFLGDGLRDAADPFTI